MQFQEQAGRCKICCLSVDFCGWTRAGLLWLQGCSQGILSMKPTQKDPLWQTAVRPLWPKLELPKPVHRNLYIWNMVLEDPVSRHRLSESSTLAQSVSWHRILYSRIFYIWNMVIIEWWPTSLIWASLWVALCKCHDRVKYTDWTSAEAVSVNKNVLVCIRGMG